MAPRFTGYDVDGGYADHVVVPAAFAYRLPADADAETLAPLLCAGIIGYRAYRRSGARKGMRIGLYGFGGSAHIVLQLAHADGGDVYVMTRGAGHRALAERLGARWVGDGETPPPVPLDAAILFAPVGTLVPAALGALERGGPLAIAGIHLARSRPSTTRPISSRSEAGERDGQHARRTARRFLEVAAAIPVTVAATPYALDDVNRALADLAHDRVNGAAVLGGRGLSRRSPRARHAPKDVATTSRTSVVSVDGGACAAAR